MLSISACSSSVRGSYRTISQVWSHWYFTIFILGCGQGLSITPCSWTYILFPFPFLTCWILSCSLSTHFLCKLNSARLVTRICRLFHYFTVFSFYWYTTNDKWRFWYHGDITPGSCNRFLLLWHFQGWPILHFCSVFHGETELCTTLRQTRVTARQFNDTSFVDFFFLKVHYVGFTGIY